MKNTGKLVIGMGLVLLQLPVQAADVIKANNTTVLNASGSWVGGSVPGSGDIAVWDNTQTATRANALGGNLSWDGMRFGSTFDVTINGTAGAGLTLGASGIDMSSTGGNVSLAFFVTGGNSTLALSSDQTWNVSAGRTLSFSNLTSSGTSTITLTGGGTVNIGPVNPFGTGAVILNNIVLAAANTTLTNAVSMVTDTTINETNGAGSLTLNGGLDIGSGTGTRTITLQSTATPTQPQVILGGTIAGNGTLAFANGNAGSTPVVNILFNNTAHVNTAGISAAANTVLNFGAANILSTTAPLTATIDGQMNLGTGGSSFSQTVGSLSGSGVIKGSPTGAGTATLTIDGGSKTSSSTFSGSIANGGTTGSGVTALTKTGTTTQILSGANTYTGATAVSGGTLLINGTHIQSANGSGYTVSSGGTLGGTGTIARFSSVTSAAIVAVTSGGTIAPGGTGTIGAFTLDGQFNNGTTSKALTMASGSGFKFDLAGNGTSADTLNFWNFNSGELTLAGNAVDFTLVGAQAAGTYTVNLFQFYSDSGTTFTTSGISAGLTLGTLDSSISAANFVYNSGGGLIQLQYTVVPEPSTYALLGVGLAGLWVLRRKKVQV